MKWLKQLQSLHTKLVIVYVLLIIIGMQIIGLYFTNSLEKELLDNFKKNITQYAKQLDVNIEKVYNDNDKGTVNAQKDIQNLLSEYANRQEIGEIRFVDKDQIIMATTKQSNRSLINQKRMTVPSKRHFLSVKPITTWSLKTMVAVRNVSGFITYQLKSTNKLSVIFT